MKTSLAAAWCPALRNALLTVAGLIIVASSGVSFLVPGTGTVAGAPRQTEPGARPADVISQSCASGNPYFVTVRRHHDLQSPGPAIVAANDTRDDAQYNPGNPAHFGFGKLADVGAAYGVAYDPAHNAVYVAASHVPAIPFGPGGPGGIYRLDLDQGRVQLAARVTAGRDHHSRGLVADPSEIQWIGRTSLGDIDSDGGRVLFVMNLEDRQIHRFSLPDMSPLGSFAHGAATTPWAANARPFGLGYRDGWLFHGVVDSREDPSLPGSLGAHVYRSRPDGSQMTEAATFDLDYARQPPWAPWTDVPVDPYPSVGHAMVGDIEFEPTGELVLGVADRLSWFMRTTGDVLPSTAGGPGQWNVVTSPEHFQDDLPPVRGYPRLAEALLGALARFPGRDRVVATGYLTSVHDGGFRWYDNSSGRTDGPGNGVEFLYVADGPSLGDIEVLCPEVTVPTPTATNIPTSTPTRGATLTETATPTQVVSSATPTTTTSPTSTWTPTLVPGPIYLPSALDQQCKERTAYVDVVLVLDVSTSMRRLTDAGRPKFDAVLDASLDFVDLLNLALGGDVAHDQVAVVGFNDTVWIEQGLTGNRAAVNGALQALYTRMAEGTRLDLALQGGTAALSGPARRQSNGSVLILLTDGLPNRVPLGPSGTQEETVLAEAAKAKSRGIVVYTVGVGRADGEIADRINPDLLRAVASAPSMFYETPDVGELSTVYAAIARKVVCPGDDIRERP